jgi:enamine deaminase RidA (YjgF/YER057c/UK114 family)
MQRGVSSEYFGMVDYQGGYVPDNKVLRNICEIGKENPIITKGPEQVVRKMQIADAAMKKAGITLKTDFDFNRFLTDEDYANAIVAIFDVIKYNFNVFDVVKQAPHFY